MDTNEPTLLDGNNQAPRDSFGANNGWQAGPPRPQDAYPRPPNIPSGGPANIRPLPQQQQQQHHHHHQPPPPPPPPAYSQSSRASSVSPTSSYSGPQNRRHPRPPHPPPPGMNPYGRQSPPRYSFMNCLKDSLHHIEWMELLPIATMAGAAVYHHYSHRHHKHVVPFREPQWVHYVNNAAMASGMYGAYKRYQRPGAGHGGGGGGIPWTRILGGLAGPMLGSMMGGGGGGHHGRPSPPYGYSGRPYSPNGGGYGHHEGNDLAGTFGRIMKSLFSKSGGHHQFNGGPSPMGGMRGMDGTRDLESQPANNEDRMYDSFDESWAIQKVVADHYYRHIYQKNQSLRDASPQAMGGAAAIRVLKYEHQMYGMMETPGVDDMKYDQMIMGMVMSEVGDLLERKAMAMEGGELPYEDSMEYVGKIAMATVIKIKMEEEKGSMYSRNRSEETASRYGQHSQRNKRRHRNRGHFNPQSEHHQSVLS